MGFNSSFKGLIQFLLTAEHVNSKHVTFVVQNLTLVLRLKSGMLMIRDKLLVMLLTGVCWEPNRRQRSRHSTHGQLLSFPPSLPLLAGVFSDAVSIARVVKSRRMRWAGHVARMGEDRGVHRVLVGKPEGKTPLGRPRLRG